MGFNSLNRAEFIGNLGSDAEVRFTTSGKAVANFSIATQQVRGGEDYTQWVRCALWGQEACDAFTPHLVTGKKVYVAGRVGTSAWEKDGEPQASLELTVRDIELLSGGKNGNSAPADEPAEDIPF